MYDQETPQFFCMGLGIRLEKSHACAHCNRNKIMHEGTITDGLKFTKIVLLKFTSFVLPLLLVNTLL